jgi:AraC-like DNA-binding protein
MSLLRPKGLLAGFHADLPETGVPELTHCGEQWLPTEWRIAPHRHAGWEFYLQVSGRTLWRVAKHDYLLAEGDFLAVGPGVQHWLVERPRRDYHICFAGLDLRPVLARQPECRPEWRRADHFVVPRAGQLAGVFSDLMQEVTGARFSRVAGIRLALDRLVLAATRLLIPDATSGSGLDHPATSRARYLIEREPGRKWQLGELARAVGVSPAHLRRCFQRDLGVPPRNFILQTRIALACRLLSASDASVTTLALELGFSSSQHFAQAFRGQTGGTARDYRRKNRSGARSRS